MNETTFRKYWNMIYWPIFFITLACFAVAIFGQPTTKTWSMIAFILLSVTNAVNDYFDYKDHGKKFALISCITFTVFAVLFICRLISYLI